MQMVRTTGRGAKKAEALLVQLENRGQSSLDAVLVPVRKILKDVKAQGDAAIKRYAQKFDSLGKDASLLVSRDEMAEAWNQLDPALAEALTVAFENIRSFAQKQLPDNWKSTVDGLTVGQLVRGLDSVGCYVPGGRHPLPSTMLMTVIPAQVAGVERIVVASPRPAPETLATAHMLGVKEFYRIGGAHAVGAFAFGSESIPRVTKIVGPGNLYVTAAKREVAFACSIDMLAGPTEIVVVSDNGRAADIADDLIAQSEHDPEALAILITTSECLAQGVLEAVRRASGKNEIAKQALQHHGYIFLAGSNKEAQTICNRLAPEHLTVDSEQDLEWVRNAGSVFIGQYSPQPMGDYISGPNHTLPTGGMAQVRGGLSIYDFLKLITVQHYTQEGLAKLGPHAARIGRAEGLDGHVAAIRQRLERGNENDQGDRK